MSLAAEVLLQRTRAEQVAAIYPEFAERYSQPGFLARESPRDLLQTIGRLGLHWRAPLMVKMAAAVEEVGTPPENEAALLQLPGVGPYAAGAFLSLHRGKRAVIVDSNIVRLYGRVFGFETDGETRRKRNVLDLAQRLTPRRHFRDFNYALLDLSMKVCKLSPQCADCPFPAGVCVYARARRAPRPRTGGRARRRRKTES